MTGPVGSTRTTAPCGIGPEQAETLRLPSVVGGDGLRADRLDVRDLHGMSTVAHLAEQIADFRSAVTGGGQEARFHLRGQLGAGAQGAVFSVADRDCRREVALKVLHADEGDSDGVSRFVHEAQLTAQLEHPGIVPVHDFGVLPDGTAFYTMKRITGQSLADWLRDRAGNPAHRFEVIEVFLDVCDAVAFAHSRGVVHRDLKPKNVMVGTYGEVLVVDWGLAKVMGAGEAASTHVSTLRAEPRDGDGSIGTLVGAAVGTPAYMSPEQARGEAERVDQRSDIYGLGVMLYESLCGASPYQRGNPRHTLAQVGAGAFTRLDAQEHGRRLPRRLLAIVHKAMAFRPEDRYQSVDELVRDLRRFLGGEAVTAYRESPAERLLRWGMRHRMSLLVAAAVVAAACVVGAGLWWQGQRALDAEVAQLERMSADREAAGDLVGARSATERLLAHRPADLRAQLRLTQYESRLRATAEREAAAGESRARAAEAARLREKALALARSDDEAGLRDAGEVLARACGLAPADAGLDQDYRRVLARAAQLAATRIESERAAGESRTRAAEADRLAAEAVAAEREGNLRSAVGKAESALGMAYSLERAALYRRLVSAFEARAAEALAVERERERAAAGVRRRGEAEAELAACAAAAAAGRGKEARERCDRARGLAPDHPDLPRHEVLAAAAEKAERAAAAEALLTEARAADARVLELRSRLDVLTVANRALAEQLAAAPEPGLRARLSAGEAEADGLARARAAALAQAVGGLNRALAIAPEHPPVRSALAAHCAARLLEAEADGLVAEAAAAEAQLRSYDDGSHADLAAGVARVRNLGRSEISLRRIATGPERTDQAQGDASQVAPGALLAVAHGRWELRAEGGVACSVRLARGQELAVDLRPPPSLPAGTAWIPAGPAYDETGRVLATVPGFALAVRETTCGEWLEFLNDPAVLARFDAAQREGMLVLAPRAGPEAAEPLWRREEAFWGGGNGFALRTAGGNPVEIPADAPVCGISHDDAIAFAAWRARRDGRPWRLPRREEWLRAAQGGDGRTHPWGAAVDLSLCASALSCVREGTWMPGGRFAADRSVQGVLDLAGSVSEFLDGSSPLGPGFRLAAGGNRSDRQPERFASWALREVDHRLPARGFGLRLALMP